MELENDNIIFKVADTVEPRIDSALKVIENMAEVGGYLKREGKDDLKQAVSDIRECFGIMKSALTGQNSEIKKSVCQVREQEPTKATERDSSHTGQVAPSTKYTTKPKVPDDQTASSGQDQTTSSEIEQVVTTSGELRKHDHDLEYLATNTNVTKCKENNTATNDEESLKYIKAKVENLMDFITNKLDNNRKQNQSKIKQTNGNTNNGRNRRKRRRVG